MARYIPPSAHRRREQRGPMVQPSLLWTRSPRYWNVSRAEQHADGGLPEQRRATSLYSIVCPPSAACLMPTQRIDKVIAQRNRVLVPVVWYVGYGIYHTYQRPNPRPKTVVRRFSLQVSYRNPLVKTYVTNKHRAKRFSSWSALGSWPTSRWYPRTTQVPTSHILAKM